MMLRRHKCFMGWTLQSADCAPRRIEAAGATTAWHNLCCCLCRGLNCSTGRKVGRDGEWHDAKNLDKAQPFVRYAAEERPPGAGKARAPPGILNLLAPE